MSGIDPVLVATAPPEGATRTPPTRKEGGVLSKRRGTVVTVIIALLALACVPMDLLLERSVASLA